MPTIGFHCSHEQIPPSQLLEDVKHAEAAGFTAAMCSDHLEPWSTDQGQSGYAWSWLGAALNATNLPFGVSPHRASGTTRSSPRRRSARSARCSPAGSGRPWARARPSTST